MEAQEFESEFSQYWTKLTVVQKQSVFSVVKNFAEANEEAAGFAIPQEEMDKIWKDREDYSNGIGKNYTREEAREYVLRNQKK